MICPECGREIPEGHLYCDTCGMEVRIVPDFEPEVENSIEESLSGVAETLTETKQEDSDGGGHERQKNLFVLSLGCIFVLALIILVAYFSVTAYFRSADYQIKTAMSEIEEENYEAALVNLEAALDAGGDFEGIKLEMAACYQALGDEQSYMESLYELIGYEQVSRERLQQGYSQIGRAHV